MSSMRRQRWLLGSLFTLAIVLSVGDRIGLGGVKNVFWQIIGQSSATLISTSQSARSLIDLIRSIRSLKTENSDQAATILKLQGEITNLQEVKHDNELLRKELGFSAAARDRFQLVPAQVIGRSPSTYQQFMILDSGAAAGISLGQAVISQGFLVGRVSEVTANTATVDLITGSRSQIPVTITTSRATGLLRGGLAGLTWEEFIPGSQPITPGEQAVTSSLGDVIPADIPVGSIETVVTGESDIVQSARLHSPVEFGKLETVFLVIVRPSANPD